MTSERSLRLPAAGTLAVGGLLAVAAWLTPVAGAEITTTAQAQTANAAFLATAVPPGPAAGVCLVDTGVDANPDTSHVVARFALDGDVTTDGSPTRHGTSMAMIMGAGLNGFGTVGLFPAVRVVSVRATLAGSETITAAGAVNAINRCNDEAEGGGLRVIELPLTLTTPPGAKEVVDLAAAIATARAKGLNVVAAAGNNGGGAVGVPASQPGALSVGGSASDGVRCAGSAAGAALQAPGCGLEEADPTKGNLLSRSSGTSQASALAAAALAALRSWQPELSVTEAEHALIESARTTPGGPLMDVAAAFRRHGLGAVVDANQVAPSAPTVFMNPSLAAPSSSTSRSGTRSPFPRPRVGVRAIRRYPGVLVTARNRPRGTMTVASAKRVDSAGQLRAVVTTARRSGRVVLRVKRWDELIVRFRDATRARATGPVTVVVHPRYRSDF